VRTGPPGYTTLRIWFLVIDSLTPFKFKNSGSGGLVRQSYSYSVPSPNRLVKLPARFLATINCLKIPALVCPTAYLDPNFGMYLSTFVQSTPVWHVGKTYCKLWGPISLSRSMTRTHIVAHTPPPPPPMWLAKTEYLRAIE
jgi:hypothetical protein